jgi:hypothetical protein
VGEGAAKVEVVYALPDQQRVVTLAMPEAGLTARAAFELSGLRDEFPELRDQPLILGIYGTVCAPDRALRDRDRVEVYRPLRVDPRVQRRERAANAARKGRKR